MEKLTLDQDNDDSPHLTFSQAHGYAERPRPLALEEISDEARVKIWDLLSMCAWRYSSRQYYTNLGWIPILRSLHSDFLRRPIDELNRRTGQDIRDFYRQGVLYSFEFHEVFDLLELIMRHESCPSGFELDMARIFVRCRLAYVVFTQEPVTILPAVTKEEGDILVEAIEEFQSAGLSGTSKHIRTAGEFINQGNWPGSIRESINAVESVARLVDPKASKTLGPALNSLERSGKLHPALKSAFNKIYGYTSDEEGIRHPLITSADSPASPGRGGFHVGGLLFLCELSVAQASKSDRKLT